MIYRESILAHENRYHDPKTGRFTSKNRGHVGMSFATKYDIDQRISDAYREASYRNAKGTPRATIKNEYGNVNNATTAYRVASEQMAKRSPKATVSQNKLGILLANKKASEARAAGTPRAMVTVDSAIKKASSMKFEDFKEKAKTTISTGLKWFKNKFG